MTADDDQPTDVDPRTDDRLDTDIVTNNSAPPVTNNSAPPVTIDLDVMTSDLDGVDAALARLAEGTYWTDEVTGEPIPPAALEANPIARRN